MSLCLLVLPEPVLQAALILPAARGRRSPHLDRLTCDLMEGIQTGGRSRGPGVCTRPATEELQGLGPVSLLQQVDQGQDPLVRDVPPWDCCSS